MLQENLLVLFDDFTMTSSHVIGLIRFMLFLRLYKRCNARRSNVSFPFFLFTSMMLKVNFFQAYVNWPDLDIYHYYFFFYICIWWHSYNVRGKGGSSEYTRYIACLLRQTELVNAGKINLLSILRKGMN